MSTRLLILIQLIFFQSFYFIFVSTIFQNELKSVSAHNLTQLRRLLKAAKEEMVRQELRNKLQVKH
jgi:hypothetical protein